MLGYTVTDIFSFLLACKYHMLFDFEVAEVAAVLDNPRCTLWPPFKLLLCVTKAFRAQAKSKARGKLSGTRQARPLVVQWPVLHWNLPKDVIQRKQ